MGEKPSPESLDALLQAVRDGAEGAFERLIEAVNEDLRAMAAQRLGAGSPSLRPSDLVNETWMRLMRSPGRSYENRQHFLAASAMTMRSVLVDHARRRGRARRGDGVRPQPLEEALDLPEHSEREVLELDAVLDELKDHDPRAWSVVMFRYWLGLDESEVADALGVSERTVRRDWSFARAWLARRLEAEGTDLPTDQSP